MEETEKQLADPDFIFDLGPRKLITKSLAGFGMGLLVGRFWVASPLVQVPGLVLLTVAEGMARYFLLQLFHFPASLAELMAHVILPQALYNGFLGSVCALGMTVIAAFRRRTWD